MVWLPLKSKISSILVATPQAAAEVADGEEDVGKDVGKGKDQKVGTRKNKRQTMKRNQGRFVTVESQRMDRLSQTSPRAKAKVERRR